MSKVKTFFLLFLTLFGIFFFIYGGSDDSPGAQLIGAVAVIIGFVKLVRGWRK